jgi:hypothetical protein
VAAAAGLLTLDEELAVAEEVVAAVDEELEVLLPPQPASSSATRIGRVRARIGAER